MESAAGNNTMMVMRTIDLHATDDDFLNEDQHEGFTAP